MISLLKYLHYNLAAYLSSLTGNYSQVVDSIENITNLVPGVADNNPNVAIAMSSSLLISLEDTMNNYETRKTGVFGVQPKLFVESLTEKETFRLKVCRSRLAIEVKLIKQQRDYL